jgi:hypothetical protein
MSGMGGSRGQFLLPPPEHHAVGVISLAAVSGALHPRSQETTYASGADHASAASPRLLLTGTVLCLK